MRQDKKLNKINAGNTMVGLIESTTVGVNWISKRGLVGSAQWWELMVCLAL